MIKQILFIITIILVCLICVRNCVGVTDSLSVGQVLQYLADAPHTSETIGNVIERFDKLSLWFSEHSEDMVERMNDPTAHITKKTIAKIEQFLTNITQVVVFAVTGVYQLIPLGLSLIFDMAYLLRIFNYLIFGVPI